MVIVIVIVTNKLKKALINLLQAELLKLYDDGHSRLDVEMKSVSSTGGDSGVEPTTPAVASNDKQ